MAVSKRYGRVLRSTQVACVDIRRGPVQSLQPFTSHDDIQVGQQLAPGCSGCSDWLSDHDVEPREVCERQPTLQGPCSLYVNSIPLHLTNSVLPVSMKRLQSEPHCIR